MGQPAVNLIKKRYRQAGPGIRDKGQHEAKERDGARFSALKSTFAFLVAGSKGKVRVTSLNFLSED